MHNFKRKQLVAAMIAAIGSTALTAQAALPSYVAAAITDAQTQLTELVGVMVAAAIIITLLALTPKVLLRMIRGLGSKVAF